MDTVLSLWILSVKLEFFSYQKTKCVIYLLNKKFAFGVFINYTVWIWEIWCRTAIFLHSTLSLSLALVLVQAIRKSVNLISIHQMIDFKHINLIKSSLKKFGIFFKRCFVNRRILFVFGLKNIGFSIAIHQVFKQRNGFQLHCCSIFFSR